MVWPVQALSARTAGFDVPAVKTVDIDWPGYGQSAAYAPGYGLLGSTGQSDPAPIASITKLVTALTVLQEKPLTASEAGEDILFTQADVTRYNDYLARQGTVAPVTPGASLSQRDMIQIMLVASANNYADSLAVWAFGSIEAYLQAANDYLTTNGLTDTVVADTTGFSPGNKSTARDLVRLGELALDHPVIAEAVNSTTLTVDGAGTFTNTNLLLHRDDAVVGIKTGTTDEAGSCLLYAKDFTVGQRTITVIGATLGAPNHLRLAADATDVLADARDGFAEVTLAEAGQTFATYEAPWGETVAAVADEPLTAVVWSGDTLQTRTAMYKLDHRDAPDQAGTVIFSQGQRQVATTKLTLETELSGPPWWWRITHPQELFASNG